MLSAPDVLRSGMLFAGGWCVMAWVKRWRQMQRSRREIRDRRAAHQAMKERN